MKLRLFVSCLFTMACSNLFSQIEINKDNHGANAGVFERGKYLKPGSLVMPTKGTNVTYDYRAAIKTGDTTPDKHFVFPDDTASFPGANRYYREGISFNGLDFGADFYEANTTTSHSLVGYGMTRQGFDISSFTGTAGDSVIFTKQKHFFKNQMTIVAYPATYQSNWTFSNRFVTDFLLNLHYSVFLKYDYSPSQRVQNITQKDTVVGWGKMMVPLDSTGSAEYDVIMVKYWEKVNDSFYIDGKPANPAILAGLGTTNGKDTFNFGYRFYRPYYSAPLMVFETNSSYTKVNSVYYDPDHLGVTGIENNSNLISEVKTFPNPSANGVYNLEFNKTANGNFKVSVQNMLGQILIEKTVSGTGHQNVSLQVDGSNGMYIYFITDTEGRNIAHGILLK